MRYIVNYFLKNFRKFLLNSQREKKLSLILSKLIKKNWKRKNLKVLDFGSGFQPLVIKLVQEKIKYKFDNIVIHSFDIYTKKQIEILEKEHKKIKFYNIKRLKNKKLKYDIAICADVLHHIGVKNTGKINSTIQLLKRKSSLIFLKDHFEYGFLTRQLLRFADFIGNYYNYVKIPKQYFTKTLIHNILKKNKLIIIQKEESYRYHSKFFLFFSNPKLHFLYVLKKA